MTITTKQTNKSQLIDSTTGFLFVEVIPSLSSNYHPHSYLLLE